MFNRENRELETDLEKAFSLIARCSKIKPDRQTDRHNKRRKLTARISSDAMHMTRICWESHEKQLKITARRFQTNHQKLEILIKKWKISPKEVGAEEFSRWSACHHTKKRNRRNRCFEQWPVSSTLTPTVIKLITTGYFSNYVKSLIARSVGLCEEIKTDDAFLLLRALLIKWKHRLKAS